MDYTYYNNNSTNINLTIDKKMEVRNNTLLKYYKFEYFEKLLNTKTLYFRSIAKFKDKYEGIAQFHSFKKFITRCKNNVSSDYAQNVASNFLNRRNEYFASCWTVNNSESYMMWKAYSDIEEGLAIVTTMNDLLDSLKIETYESNKDIFEIQKFFHGILDYGYKSNWDSDHIIAFGKNVFFQDENEFRIVIYKHPIEKETISLSIDIDINKLINKIILAPQSSPQFQIKVRKLLTTKNLNTDLLKRSKLMSDETEIIKEYYQSLNIENKL